MASRAVLGGVHFPVMDKLGSLGELSFFGRCPVQIVDVLGMADLLLGSAMAFKTESHAEGFGMVDLIHLVDFSVTVDTADTAVHMHRVIEIDVIRGFVDLHPFDGFTLAVGLPHQLELWILRKNLVVTVHAGRGGGNIGEP
jgi:hypothetical protein